MIELKLDPEQKKVYVKYVIKDDSVFKKPIETWLDLDMVDKYKGLVYTRAEEGFIYFKITQGILDLVSSDEKPSPKKKKEPLTIVEKKKPIKFAEGVFDENNVFSVFELPLIRFKSNFFPFTKEEIENNYIVENCIVRLVLIDKTNDIKTYMGTRTVKKVKNRLGIYTTPKDLIKIKEILNTEYNNLMIIKVEISSIVLKSGTVASLAKYKLAPNDAPNKIPNPIIVETNNFEKRDKYSAKNLKTILHNDMTQHLEMMRDSR